MYTRVTDESCVKYSECTAEHPHANPSQETAHALVRQPVLRCCKTGDYSKLQRRDRSILPGSIRGFDKMAKNDDPIPMVNWVYDLMLWVMSVLIDLFFREVHPRGSWRVPRQGPVLFVAAPHANQVGSQVTLFHN